MATKQSKERTHTPALKTKTTKKESRSTTRLPHVDPATTTTVDSSRRMTKLYSPNAVRSDPPPPLPVPTFVSHSNSRSTQHSRRHKTLRALQEQFPARKCNNPQQENLIKVPQPEDQPLPVLRRGEQEIAVPLWRKSCSTLECIHRHQLSSQLRNMSKNARCLFAPWGILASTTTPICVWNLTSTEHRSARRIGSTDSSPGLL